MGIKPNFDMAAVARKFDALLQFIDDETLRALRYVGEKAVTYARNIKPPDQGGKGFKDQTGNLRSSIGFAIYYDGKQLEASYEGTATGTGTGKALADTVGAQTSGYALVVTAGMFYAVYVESKGRDVLTTAEQHAGDWLKTELDDIKNAVMEEWKRL